MRTDFLSAARFLLDKQQVHIGSTRKYYRLSDNGSEQLNDSEFESSSSFESVSKELGGSRK